MPHTTDLPDARRPHNTRALICALVLAAGSGAALAQEQRGGPGNQPASGNPQAVPVTPSAQPMTPEQAEKLREEQRKQAEIAGMPQPGVAVPAPGGEAFAQPGAPNGAQPPGLQPDAQDKAGLGALVDADGNISLNFTEPVDLSAFVEYVSRALAVNIFADPTLQNKQVLFRAPLRIKADQLLPLLSALLEEQNFVLTRDQLGFYTIRQVANVPVEIAGDQFATTRIIPTPMIRPSAIQAAITNAFGQQGQQAVRITSVDELSVLVATGTPRALNSVEAFIESTVKRMREFRLFPFELKSVTPQFARERVLTLAGKVGGGGIGLGIAAGGAPNPAVGMSVAAGGTLLQLDTRLIPDQGNTLLFRGTADEAEQVRELVALVDRVAPLIARQYVVGPAAQDLAIRGEAMGLGPVGFANPGAGQSGFSGFSGGPRAGGPANPFGVQEQTIAGSGFTIDEQNGSIIYYGTEEQHEIVSRLVKEFTEQARGEAIQIEMYKLKYGEAKSVAELLNNIIQEPGTQTARAPLLPGGGRRATGTAAAGGDQGRAAAQAAAEAAAGPTSAGETGFAVSATEVVITADEARNQILIRGPRRVQQQLARLIERLDQKQPQVHIQAQIVSVSSVNGFEWALDAQIKAGQFASFTSFGLTSAATGAAFNARRVPATNQSGFNAALIKNDYLPFVINALSTEDRGRIVSMPAITVNDNKEGKLESNREVPFSTVSQGGQTTVTGQGGVATAGTTLTVKPRISKGGDIVLEYSVELSDFTGTAQAGLQPPKQKESYKSEVTVPTDTTIVVGGFKLRRSTQSETKVPLLGDLPLIGLAFKNINNNTTETMIYVFITPRILSDPINRDLALMSEGPMRDASIAPVMPELKAVTIPISGQVFQPDRLIPANPAASDANK
ncbi:MAG: hypothetical protein IBJ11_07080 [Phycisphaerales bacterium]|nr:hypothetical protein [Phycisphaerales bacterium]